MLEKGLICNCYIVNIFSYLRINFHLNEVGVKTRRDLPYLGRWKLGKAAAATSISGEQWRQSQPPRSADGQTNWEAKSQSPTSCSMANAISNEGISGNLAQLISSTLGGRDPADWWGT